MMLMCYTGKQRDWCANTKEETRLQVSHQAPFTLCAVDKNMIFTQPLSFSIYKAGDWMAVSLN